MPKTSDLLVIPSKGTPIPGTSYLERCCYYEVVFNSGLRVMMRCSGGTPWTSTSMHAVAKIT